MPTGAILVNPAKPKAKFSASRLLAAIGAKKNGKHLTRKNRGAKANRAKMRSNGGSRRIRRNAGRYAKVAKRNGMKRSYKFNKGGKGMYRKNGALLTNRRHGKRRKSGGKYKFRRNGALLTNGKRRHGKRHYRRNPDGATGGNKKRTRKPRTMFSAITTPIQKVLGKVPVVGSYASSAVGFAVAGLSAGVGVVALRAAMTYGADYFPEMVKPVANTVAGSVIAALVAAFVPASVPGKSLLVAGLPAAGVALDVNRYLNGQSYTLNGALVLSGDEMGDAWGEVDDLGGPFAASEYADASLYDAGYSGDDLTDDEIAAAEFGRPQFWRIFRPRYAPAQAAPITPNVSHHAGVPGRRWGWLIWMLGMDRFKNLAAQPAGVRQNFIRGLRNDAILRANRALQMGIEPTMESASTNGLLVAA